MKQHKPFFSVVIPLYNKANFIENCVESVLKQSFTNFELIIVNDGSTDDSLSKIQLLTDERLQIVNQENQGAAAARNKGVKLAKSEWIAFLDADDFWLNKHLEIHYNNIQRFPEEFVFISQPKIIGANGNEFLPTYNFKVPAQAILLSYFKNSLVQDLLVTPGLVIQKQFFNQVGKFDENIKSGQDTDLFIRIGLQTKVVFHPEISFGYYLVSENNISKTNRYQERLDLLKKYDDLAIKNKALKKYLNQNRYGIYLRSKIAGNAIWKSAKAQIDNRLLSGKQKILLSLPSIILRFLKFIQIELQKKGIKKSAF